MGKVAVRVDEADSGTGFDALNEKIVQKRGFTRSSFTDDVDVSSTVFRFDTEVRFGLAPRNAFAEYDFVTHGSKVSFQSLSDIQREKEPRG